MDFPDPAQASTWTFRPTRIWSIMSCCSSLGAFICLNRLKIYECLPLCLFCSSASNIRAGRSEIAVSNGAEKTQLFFGFGSSGAFGEDVAAFVIYNLPAVAAGSSSDGVGHIYSLPT